MISRYLAPDLYTCVGLIHLLIYTFSNFKKVIQKFIVKKMDFTQKPLKKRPFICEKINDNNGELLINNRDMKLFVNFYSESLICICVRF